MKNKLFNILIFLNLLICFGALAAEEKITIINSAGLYSAELESVRTYMEKELYVTVTSTNMLSLTGGNLQEIGKLAAKTKKPTDACLIVFGNPSKNSAMHYEIMTKEQIAVINVEAVISTNPEVTTRRLQRISMRAAASLFGIGSDPDPFCVMHDYKTLNDLDNMGTNFSPPWGEKFRQAAKARGLTVRPLFTLRQRPVTTNAVPVAPVPVKGN